MFSKSTLVSSSLLLLASLRAVSAQDQAQALWVSVSDGSAQCQQQQIYFGGGEAAVYDVEVFTSCSDPNDAPLASFEDVTGSVTWQTVSLPAGSNYFVVVSDGRNEAYTQDIRVGDGTTTSCLAATSSSTTTSTTTTPAAGGSTPTGASTPDSNPALTGSTGSKSNPQANPNGVNNAASDPNPSSQGSTAGKGSGAFAVVASRPLELAAGLVALTFALTC